MSHPAGKVKIEVFAESRRELADEEQDFTGRPAGTPLIVTWTPSSDAPVATHRGHTPTTRRGSWVGVEIAPWFVPIPHEDVNFKTGSADIDDRRDAQARGRLHQARGGARQGRRHTAACTRASRSSSPATPTPSVRAAHNLKLSQDRARSIASWFRKRGVKLPDLVRGLRRDVARGQDRRQRRRAAQPPRRLRPLRRPADLLGRLQAELEADPLTGRAPLAPLCSSAGARGTGIRSAFAPEGLDRRAEQQSRPPQLRPTEHPSPSLPQSSAPLRRKRRPPRGSGPPRGKTAPPTSPPEVDTSGAEVKRGGGAGTPRPKLSRAALLFRPTIPTLGA